ncbi:serine hydrolase domain-containing protein [Leptospira idonii]|uniref:Class A beta-lactamase-related serine hydrolase n=1 Tax=Leptospira idonii TaxID=1193500 RepID=A0A4R9LYI7_9LEPT|nr:serine hydrolase domain-containing protein [Leptospira idonii]TGN18417.1 class A beta-lactamase-related serine hydrolase [Leptospira idonii]
MIEWIRLKFFISLILLLSLLSCKIASVTEAEKEAEAVFLNKVQNGKNIKTGTLLVHSDRLQLHWKFGYEKVSKEEKQSKYASDRPFHIASIGKVFTSVLIWKQIEIGKLSLNDPVEKILGKEILKDLFVFQGKDHSSEVTISHLLSHTSGIADYFESTDSNPNGSQISVLEEIRKDPKKFWTPKELLDFTKHHLKAVSIPGEKFHYSDTGYILLGLVVEKLSGRTFEKELEEIIFSHLGMNHSYMHLRSKPKEKTNLPLSRMSLGDTDVTDYTSVSADWAGGGIISTAEDLLLFQKALVSGKLIRQETYERMKGSYPFRDGILYGYGLMTVRFGDILFLMAGTPDVHGHSGILSTLMFYCPEYDAHIISNFGSSDDIEGSFEMMFRLLSFLEAVNKLRLNGS